MLLWSFESVPEISLPPCTVLCRTEECSARLFSPSTYPYVRTAMRGAQVKGHFSAFWSVIATVKKTISLLENQGTRNHQESIDSLILHETVISESVWKINEEERKGKTKKTIIKSMTQHFKRNGTQVFSGIKSKIKECVQAHSLT